MDEKLSLIDELHVLDAAALRLRIDAFEDLILEAGGPGAPCRVVPARGFPVTRRSEWISLRDGDGEEIGLIEDMAQLDPDSREALERELHRTYILPRITRIDAIEDHYHVPAWEVQTDRGPRTIEIRSTRRDIRLMRGGHVMIRDADGNHYEIPDYHRLDPESLSLLQSQI